MPHYRMGSTVAHLNLGGKYRKRPPPHCCARMPQPDAPAQTMRCNAMATLLCDWKVEDGTCDAPLCVEHAHQVGPDRHLCPIHRAQRAADEPELF